MEPPDHPRELAAELRWPPGWHVRHVVETGSTNADLLAEADTASDRTVLVTDHQTAGRGRLDRRWEAPPGANLLVSLLFRDVAADGASELARRVGLAAVAAVDELTDVAAVLKWPNDVLVGDRKLGGILAQASGDAVVVGLGLNVGWAPDDAVALDGGLRPSEVLAALLEAFDELPDDIHERYRAALSTIGTRVRVVLPASEIVGRALDVDRSGRLVVVDECGVTHRLDVGDVVHLRGS